MHVLKCAARFVFLFSTICRLFRKSVSVHIIPTFLIKPELKSGHPFREIKECISSHFAIRSARVLIIKNVLKTDTA